MSQVPTLIRQNISNLRPYGQGLESTTRNTSWTRATPPRPPGARRRCRGQSATPNLVLPRTTSTSGITGGERPTPASTQKARYRRSCGRGADLRSSSLTAAWVFSTEATAGPTLRVGRGLGHVGAGEQPCPGQTTTSGRDDHIGADGRVGANGHVGAGFDTGKAGEWRKRIHGKIRHPGDQPQLPGATTAGADRGRVAGDARRQECADPGRGA